MAMNIIKDVDGAEQFFLGQKQWILMNYQYLFFGICPVITCISVCLSRVCLCALYYFHGGALDVLSLI